MLEKEGSSKTPLSFWGTSMKHPMQPIHLDDQGVARFQGNAIVGYLLEAGPFDLNHLATIVFPEGDAEQFAQLLGYSVSGFGDLSYSTKESARIANKIANGLVLDQGLEEPDGL